MEKAISEILKTAFDPYFKAPIEAWSSFSKLGEIQTFDKEQIIKKADETERYVYFIIKGSGGVFCWHHKYLNVLICVMSPTSLVIICLSLLKNRVR